MKLVSCSVQNFGKLQNFEYNFEPGFNVICHENGWGKSTLLGFIKAMFYGLPTSRSSDITQNERIRFMPWQGGIFGGSLTIELDDGKRYRIERSFGSKESEDVFQLIDCDTNLQSFNYNSNIGEELFSIDASCFEKSAFISEFLSNGKGDYSSVQSKLIDLDDVAKLESAQKRLKDKVKFYHLSSKNGKIDKAEIRLSELRQARVESEASLKIISEKKKQITDLRLQIDNLSKEERELQKQLTTSTAIRTQSGLDSRKADLISKKERCKKELDETSSKLSGNIPNRRELEEMRDLAKDFKQKAAPNIADKNLPIFFPISIFALSILFFVFALVFHSMPILLAVFLFLSFASIAGGIVLLSSISRKAKEIKAQETTVFEYQSQKQTLLDYVSQYPILFADAKEDILSTIYNIGITLDDYNQVNRNYQEASDDLENFLNNHKEDESITREEAEKQQAELNAKISQLKDQIGELRTKESTLQMDIGRLSETGDKYTEISQEISHLEEEIQTDKNHLYILEQTSALLEESYKRLTTRYIGDIQRYFRNNLKILTEQDIDSPLSDEYLIESYTVASDFTVNVNKFGKTRSTSTLSRGGRDLIALCTRFAISEALFSGQKPFMVLDDPFINLDDEKVQASLTFLRNLASEKQIIYVCCHSSRK